MTEDRTDGSRRRFLTRSLMGLAAMPAVGLALPGRVAAQDLPHLKEDDPSAKALKYHEDASEVTAASRQNGAHCATCQLYTGDREAEWGPCGVFPGKAVHSQGWCSAWVKKA